MDSLEYTVDLWLLFHADDIVYNHGKGKSEDSLDYVFDLWQLIQADEMLYNHGKERARTHLNMVDL